MSTRNYMVTTADNKWNPFTQFEEWLAYDSNHGYNTPQWIDCFCMTSSNLEEFIIEDDVANATKAFLELNPYGIHYKVYEDEADKLIPIMNKAYSSLKAETA